MTGAERVGSMMGSRNARTGIRSNNRISGRALGMTGRQVLIVVCMVFLFMGSGIGYAWFNFERTQIGYDLSQLQKEEMRQAEINKKLRLELALAKSPRRIEEVAIGRLGLAQPTAKQVVVLP